MLKKFIKHLLASFGIELRRIRNSSAHLPGHPHSGDMNGGLLRLKKLDFYFKTIVDVGAAKGEWTKLAKSKWPEAAYVLFEPLVERKEQLDELAKAYPGVYLVSAAAGRQSGTVSFSVTADLDGSGVADDLDNAQGRVVDVKSIQEEIRRFDLRGPFLVKLDTHGFELPILDGCNEIWDDISVLIIECYGFRIAKDSLLFWEMCAHLDKRGFRVFDIVDTMRRFRDGAFWQCDAFFIRRDHDVFRNNSYG